MGENLFASTALALVASLMAASATQAADEPAEVETLIVTANKRAENIQDVPMSVSAVSGDYLEKVGIGNVTELSRFVPSVNITQSNNNRNSTIFVRGIGTSGTNPGIESSVGIFIDGVYIVAAGPIQSNLQDISTVEVLRGPQGTLYGRNTPVGAINITSREPSQDFEAMAACVPDALVDEIAIACTPDEFEERLAQWNDITPEPMLFPAAVGVQQAHMEETLDAVFDLAERRSGAA
jgi:outer membrane receptor protein involved in Fe transport